MPKLAICKINMIGEPVLVLGIGRTFVEGDEHWTKLQLYTMETYLNCQYTYTPPADGDYCSCIYNSQEECDEAAEKMRDAAKTRAKFHGDEVYFENLGRSVPVTKFGHDFSFADAQQIEVSVSDLDLLQKDINDGPWMDFDLETWGK